MKRLIQGDEEAKGAAVYPYSGAVVVLFVTAIARVWSKMTKIML